MLNVIIAVWSFFAGYGLICFVDDHKIIEQIQNNLNKVGCHFEIVYQQFLNWFVAVLNKVTFDDHINYFPEIESNLEVIEVTPFLETVCKEKIKKLGGTDLWL